MNRRPALAVTGLVLAVISVVTGCRGDGGSPSPVPATFGPSPFGPPPCPPGWHETSDGGCLITGTTRPGQDLPVPPPAPQPAGTLAVYVRPQ